MHTKAPLWLVLVGSVLAQDDIRVTGEEFQVKTGFYRGPAYYYSHVGSWLLRLCNEKMAKRSRGTLDVYEFGVFTGNRMKELAGRNGLKDFGHMWGFDSFTGYPNETPGIWVPHPTWRDGGLSASDALGKHNATELFSFLRERIRYDNLTFVAGYFSDSLNDNLLRRYRFQPALIVDLDCDMYLSTVQALRWLFGSGTIMQPGTLVRYDDWPGNQTALGGTRSDGLWGQTLAHVEVTTAFKVEWGRVNRNVFEVLSIGGKAEDALAHVDTCYHRPCW